MAHYYDKDTGMDLLAPYTFRPEVEEIFLTADKTKKANLFLIGVQENNGNTVFFRFNCLNFIAHVFASKYNDEAELTKSVNYVVELHSFKNTYISITEEAFNKWNALYPDLNIRNCIVNFGVKLNKAIIEELKKQDIDCNIFDKLGVISYDGDILAHWDKINPIVTKCNESVVKILDEAERVATIEKEHSETEEREINEE